MPTPIELTLSTLLPTLHILPPELLHLSTSLLAQSRTKAASLKPEEEIARTYACCHIACQRLGHKLRLEIAKPSPPCKPKVYNKLHGYFNAVLATPKPTRKGHVDTPSASQQDGKSATTTPAKTTTTASSSPAIGKRAQREEEVDVPAFVMPMIRHMCKAFKAPQIAPHVFTGVRSILQPSNIDEPLPKKRRTPTKTTRPLMQEDSIPGLVATLFAAVMDRMRFRDADDASKDDEHITQTAKEYCVQHTKDLPFDLDPDRDLLADMNEYSRASLSEWTSMEWFSNIPAPDELNEVEAGSADELPIRANGTSKTPLRRKEKHGQRDAVKEDEVGAAGLLPGLGTMFQPAVDWLSEERRAEHARWRKDMLQQLAVVRQRA